MTSLCRALLLTGFVVCSTATASMAATYSSTQDVDLGTFSGLQGNDSAGLGRSLEPGSFTDTYRFETSNRTKIAATITNATSDMTDWISDFTLSFYRGTPGSGSFITSVMANQISAGEQQGGFGPLLENVDSYYLIVSGSTMDSPTYGGSISLRISAVPLPPALSMFGAALIGLGVAGYGLKKRGPTTA